jgi:hypothetical protein
LAAGGEKVKYFAFYTPWLTLRERKKKKINYYYFFLLFILQFKKQFNFFICKLNFLDHYLTPKCIFIHSSCIHILLCRCEERNFASYPPHPWLRSQERYFASYPLIFLESNSGSGKQSKAKQSIRGRAVKALRSGRSQLCWRGFDSRRMHFFFFFFSFLPLPFLCWD